VKVFLVLAGALLVVAAAGCGGGSSTVTIQPAAVYSLDGFEPSAPVPAGKPTRVSFITDPLPRTPVGKLDRKVLREPHWEGTDRRVGGG